ncbi:MAG TPA: sugar ABC transporter substrate-binding protein, partial [Allocoleopsis sp.]
MNTQKKFIIFTLLGLLFSWLVSCGTNPTPSNSPQTQGGVKTEQIEFWTMQLQPQYTDYFNQLITDFQSANPNIKVSWQDIPWSGMQSKILTSVSAKTAPDVVNLNPDFASELANRNAWLTLDAKIPDAIRQEYLPNMWQANSLNNKIFGIPWYLTTNVTIYNTDLFKQAGITTPPTTYIELAQVAQKVKEKTGKYAFFITCVPSDSNELLESLVSMGVKLVDDQGKAAFNSPEGKTAFQYWIDLYQKGFLPKESLTQGQRDGINLYQSGQTAILLSGSEVLNTIEKNAPAIAKVSALSPQISGNTNKTNVAVMNLVINNDSKHPDSALKFALFVTNNQNQLVFAQKANVLP